jgi:SAM-dependent methyltransferase
MHLLDVGCGNNAPYITKTLFPLFHYTGIDVADYNQSSPNLADQYIVTTPEQFHENIVKLGKFDCVVSSHNLEHVDEREKTLVAMISAVKNGGYIFLAFPTEASVHFPSRKKTLNYFDDPTHKESPPIFYGCMYLSSKEWI